MSAMRITSLAPVPPPPPLRIVRPPLPRSLRRKAAQAKKRPKKQRIQVTEHELDNASDEITCQRREGCRRLTTYASCSVRVRWRVIDGEALQSTADAFDRAHNVRDLRGHLVPSAAGTGPAKCSRVRVAVESSRPRRYPASSMAASGVSIDSVYDDLYERMVRLGGIPGIGIGEVGTSAEELLARWDARLGDDDPRFRDLVHQRTRQRLTARERELQRAGSELLGIS